MDLLNNYPKLDYNDYTMFGRGIRIDFETQINSELNKLGEFKISRLIFNDPATIIFWKDGTKTIVKCGPEDEFDPYKGIALCFMKKARGNKGNYNDVFRIFDEEICNAVIESELKKRDKKGKKK